MCINKINHVTTSPYIHLHIHHLAHRKEKCTHTWNTITKEVSHIESSHEYKSTNYNTCDEIESKVVYDIYH